MKSLLKYLLPTLAIIFYITGCDTKKPATGHEDLIHVVADSLEYEQLESTLLQIFGKVIYTPQPENLFELKRVSVNRINEVKNKKNVIIMAPFGSGSMTSDYLNTMIDSTVQHMVLNEGEFVFNKRDLWAKDQLVMILTAPSIDELKMSMLQDHENLLYQFQDISNKRLFKSLYNPKYEQYDIEAKLLDNYGWIIYVQADFLLAKDAPEENFVWLRRAVNTDMERWIFVHWIENASPELLNNDFIYSERNKMTEKFYRTTADTAYVEIADQYLNTREVNFEGKYALMTQGLWRFSDKSGGGPFVNYTFFDENTHRIYMLDGSIYAPKYYKKKLIQQVDVTLQSFRTKEELTQDKIDELMDELKN